MATLARAAHWSCPPPLCPGDRVRIIAPSGPFDRTLLLRGAGWLAERYRVEFDRGIFAREGFLAGSDARRLAELDAALRCPDLRAVICARGGYGLSRIVYRADLGALRRRPKWIVGFSDATALHLEASRAGVMSMHAHNAAGLGRADATARARWVAALEEPERPRRYEHLAIWKRGRARGPIVGGNLTLVFTAAAAGKLDLPWGCLLLLEDVTESSYRIDRMLTALLTSGQLDRIAAVLVGELTDCPAGPHGVSPEQVLQERLGGLGVPVAAGLPVGHGRHNDPLPLGMEAELDATGPTGAVLTVAPAKRSSPR